MIDVSSFEQRWSFLKEKDVFIACSGGADSMVLVHLIRQFCPKITLLHVNYNLRGEESLEDAAFVKAYAKKHHLSFEEKTVDAKTAFKEGNLQEVARKIRYNWFEEKIQNDRAALLIAHNEDDQLETFYQNLARKSGIQGLSCMLEIQDKKMRPLLNFSKKEIYEYAEKKHLQWREDRSNQSNNYSRNRLRNEFLPFVQKQIPELKQAVLTLIRVFQENRRELEKSLEPLLSEMQKNAFLDLEEWQQLNEEQQLILLKNFDFNPAQLSEINKLTKAQKGKAVASFSHTIVKENGGFSFVNKTSEKSVPKLEINSVSSLPETFSKDVIYLDADKISGELKLVCWQPGDRISPLGMKGSKLISDIITDAKIPHSERKNVLVLKDDKNILWCPGLKIARTALAHEGTKNILQIIVF